jgi:hypothetical protein
MSTATVSHLPDATTVHAYYPYGSTPASQPVTPVAEPKNTVSVIIKWLVTFIATFTVLRWVPVTEDNRPRGAGLASDFVTSLVIALAIGLVDWFEPQLNTLSAYLCGQVMSPTGMPARTTPFPRAF